MKKLFMGVVVLCLTPLAFANGGYIAQPMGQSVFDGFYLGAGPSLIATTGKAKTDFDHSPLKWTEYDKPGHEEFPLSDYGFGVGGFGGYGVTYHQNLYLGGELFANYSPMKTFGSKMEFNPHLYADQVKSDYTLGAALRIGYLLSQKSMIYALVGGDYTNFKVNSLDGNKPAGMYGVSPSVTKHVIGFMPGIGMETMLNKNWALRGQYTYSLYSKFTDTYSGTDGHSPVNAKTKYDLNRSTFNLAAVYHFDPSGARQNLTLPLSNNNPNESLSGFYLGLGPELTAVTGKVENQMSFNGDSSENKFKISSFYPGITGIGGYGNSYQNWYIGGELFADYSPVRSKTILSGGDIHLTGEKIKSDYSYGPALRGGYLFSPKSMVYALVGADFTQFKFRTYYGNYNNPNVYVESPKITKNVVGFMPGIGFESMMCDNLSARVQYTYSIYPSLKENDNVVRGDVKYEPARSRIAVLLSYHFNPM